MLDLGYYHRKLFKTTTKKSKKENQGHGPWL